MVPKIKKKCSSNVRSLALMYAMFRTSTFVRIPFAKYSVFNICALAKGVEAFISIIGKQRLERPSN